jgi:hypothetical protein
MPVLLNRAYPLTVIGASLDLEEDAEPGEPLGVHVEVDLPDDVRLQRDLGLDDLGLPLDLRGIDSALGKRLPMSLPHAWHLELLRALEPAPKDEPVWLDFRRPFGHLPAIPWERLMLPQLGFPLLRLPFSAVPPPELPSDLRIAVCAPWSGTPALRDFLGRVIPVVPGARVEVFAPDGGTGEPRVPGVTFHRPPPDDDAIPPPDSADEGPDNPWLRWMLGAIGTDTVDVVHVICPGRVSDNFGMLDFGSSPSGTENPRTIRLVSVAQLLSFLTRIGAWSLTIAQPAIEAARRGEAGLRIFTHRMTGLLSGPVVLQAPNGPVEELASAYRFLYAPGLQEIPVAPSLMLACHPGLVRSRTTASSYPRTPDAVAEQIERATRECTLDPDVLLTARQDSSQPYAWVASSQRILERWTSNLLGTEVDPGVSGTTSRGVTDALSFISKSIESSVRERGGDR